MITFEQAEDANNFIRDNAKKYAEFTAQREQLEEYLKIKEATLMGEIDGAEHVKKSYARSHKDYKEIVDGRKEARTEELRLRWMMTAAQAKIDMWRSYNASNRMGV